jgi:helix-turn-helix protein
MEGYPIAAVERAMKVQEVILKAMAGKMRWLEAAEVLGIRPRTLRRWKWRMEHQGMNALLDRRCGVPSPRRVPGTEVEGILALYRERYTGLTVRHFHDLAVRDHGLRRSYTFVKHLLQTARLVRKQRARGKHRRRRERRACFGEMLHLDGSRHVWLALVPGQYQSLITVPDDATSRLLYAQLWPSEGTRAVMTALRTVCLAHGLPQQLYTDRASWAARTPKAGGPPDPRPTQLGRALEELGIEHLRAYSPQARGRSERLNRTLQGRLVPELRLLGIRTLEAANRYLDQRFLSDFNQRFARAPADPASGFVPLAAVDLDQYLCLRCERRVGRDNTVVLGKTVLQIAQQPERRSCQGLRVSVRQHLDGSFTVSTGPRTLARYDPHGHPRPLELPRDRQPPTRIRRLPAARHRDPSVGRPGDRASRPILGGRPSSHPPRNHRGAHKEVSTHA